MSVPLSNAPSERVFSNAENIVNDKRYRLAPRTTEALVFLHDNSDLLDIFSDRNDIWSKNKLLAEIETIAAVDCIELSPQ